MKTVNLLRISAAVLTAACGSAQAGVYKKMKETEVSCGNALTCEARLTPKAGAETQGILALTLRRAAGPEAAPEWIIGTESPAPPAGETVFSADGKQAAVIAAKDLRYDALAGGYVARAPGLAAALRDAQTLSVTMAGGKPLKGAFSLAGLAGAYLLMDETQGRLGASDALAKPGAGKPAPAPVREIAAYKQLPASVRADFDSSEAACGFPEESDFAARGGFAVSLAQGATLWALPCGIGGAYNQGYAFYLERDGKTERLMLPVIGQEGPEVTDQAVNPDWNHAGRELTAFNKGRGIGDCGTFARWKLAEDRDPPGFILKEMRVKEDCDGKGEGPEGWPLLWPARAFLDR